MNVILGGVWMVKCGVGYCDSGKVCDKEGTCVRKCDKREYVEKDKDVCGCWDVDKSGYVKCGKDEICGEEGCLKCNEVANNVFRQEIRRVCALHKGRLKLMECENDDGWEEEICGSQEVCADTWGCVKECQRDEICKDSGDRCQLVQAISGKLSTIAVINHSGNVNLMDRVCTCGDSLGCRVLNEDREHKVKCGSLTKFLGNDGDFKIRKKVCQVEAQQWDGFETSDIKDVCRADERVVSRTNEAFCACGGGVNAMCELGEVCKSKQCVNPFNQFIVSNR